MLDRYFGRREFVILTASAAGAALLSSCVPSVPESPEAKRERVNGEFAGRLLSLMEYHPSLSDDQLAELTHRKTYKDTGWVKKGVVLSGFVNDFGQEINLSLNTIGGPIGTPLRKNEPKAIYPRFEQPPRRVLITSSKEPLEKPLDVENIRKQNKRVNVAMVYGPPEIYQYFADDRLKVVRFIDGYFTPSHSKATINVLHIDLYDGNTPYTDIGGLGLRPFIASTSLAISMSARPVAGTGAEAPVIRHDIILKLPRIHHESRSLGLKMGTLGEMVIADEKLNLLAQHYSSFPITIETDESFSTLGGFAAGFDKSFADRINGDYHDGFTTLLENTMNTIAPDPTPQPKKLAAKISRRDFVFFRWSEESASGMIYPMPVEVKVTENSGYNDTELVTWENPLNEAHQYQYDYPSGV